MSDAETLVRVLRDKGLTLATSESLTAGMIGAAITAVPGASAVYVGGVIVYATRLKAVLSGVSQATLDAFGPVSQRTAIELAIGIRERTGADWAVSATGVAGPEGQDGHEPGEVWLGLAGPLGEDGQPRGTARRYQFEGDRQSIREQTVAAALSLAIEVVTSRFDASSIKPRTA